MSDFTNSVITNVGRTLANQAVQNQQAISLTRVACGSGYCPGGTDPKTLTSLFTWRANYTPSSANTLVAGQATFTFTIDTFAGGFSGYQLNEVGIYGQLPGGSETLLCYASMQGGDTLVSHTTNDTYTLVVKWDNAATMTATVNMQFTLPLHAAAHLDNGLDPISVATTSRTGLLMKLSGVATDVLHGDGTWSGGFLPGFMIDYGGSSAPSGWLLCDGSAVSRTTYAGLFAVLGTAFGTGDGSTTFNVPDFRGRASIGSGQGSGLTLRVIGAKGGEEVHVLTVSEIPSHTHGINESPHSHFVNDPGHAHSISDPGHQHSTFYEECYSVGNAWGGVPNPSYNFTAAWTPSTRNATGIGIYAALTGILLSAASTGITNQYTGGGANHNNMQPFLVVTKIIKT